MLGRNDPTPVAAQPDGCWRLASDAAVGVWLGVQGTIPVCYQLRECLGAAAAANSARYRNSKMLRPNKEPCLAPSSRKRPHGIGLRAAYVAF